MESNVRKMLENAQEVELMEEKSTSIRDTAFHVQSQARKLEQETRRR